MYPVDPGEWFETALDSKYCNGMKESAKMTME